MEEEKVILYDAIAHLVTFVFEVQFVTMGSVDMYKTKQETELKLPLMFFSQISNLKAAEQLKSYKRRIRKINFISY